MSVTTRPLWLAAALFSVPLLACGGDGASAPTDTATTDTAPADTSQVDSTQGDAASDTAQSHRLAHVVILHTANERGWIDGTLYAGSERVGGAAVIKGLWNNAEPAARLTLSSGDSLVGAPISTWFDGAPAVEVMNALGYDAIALGHHELDLGRDRLATWLDDASFSVLAANLVEPSGGPAMCDAPYQLFPVDGANVAVIGVAHPGTPELAAGPHYDGVTFEQPSAPVAAAAAAARAEGADVIVVLAHLAAAPVDALATALGSTVDVILGGHGAGRSSRTVNGVLVAEAGFAWDGYIRVALTVDVDSAQVVQSAAVWRVADDPRILPDPAVQAIVAQWKTAMDEALGDTIGYITHAMARASWIQANWVTDSWRWSLPEADIALQNSGGLQGSISAGEITRADVVSVLSYDNSIMQVDLTGAEILAQLDGAITYCGTGCFVAVSGIRYGVGAEGLTVQLEDGSPLDPAATYTVLVNNFMYYGGAGFNIDGPGREPIETGLNYRDPVMQWTEAQGTTVDAPLDALLDHAPRNTID